MGVTMYDDFLSRFINYIKQEYKTQPIIVSLAPGRADFLNTHQDYKGLPVVPAALNLYVGIGILRFSDKIIVESLNLKEKGEEFRDEFSIEKLELVENRWFGNYLRSCVIEFTRRGFQLKKGFHAVIWATIPIGAGLGSSGALEVAFVKLLAELTNITLSPIEIAEIAYIAEHDIMKIPCGRLDQYASSFGNIIVLYPKPPVKVEKISADLSLAVIDSGIKHATAQIHPVRQKELDLALEMLRNLPNLPEKLKSKLRGRYYEVAWDQIKLEEIQRFLDQIEDTLAKRIEFTLRMNDLTIVAIRILKREPLTKRDIEILQREKIEITKDYFKILAEIINKQHELLRDLYDVSLPELEKIRNAALDAGAHAVKISGAGLGGCLIALVDKEKFPNVKDACIDAGAKRVWFCHVSDGAKFIYL